MLSGFILTYTHAREWERKRGSRARFYFARFARIYPVYLLSMVAAGLLYSASFRSVRGVVAYAIDLLMIQSWSARTVLFYNIPAWTLSCEAFFYVVFPLVLLRIRPRSRRMAVLEILALWILAMIPPAVWMYSHLGLNWALWAPEQPGSVALAIGRNPAFALPEFLAGMVVGWAQVQFRPSRRSAVWLTILGLIGTIVPLLLSERLSNPLLRNGLLIPAFGAVMLGLASDTPISRALSVRPLLLLGEASYAFYLSHFLFNSWVSGRFHAGHSWVDAVWKLAIIIPISIGVYLGVERPARKWLLRWWNRHSARDRGTGMREPAPSLRRDTQIGRRSMTPPWE